MPVKAVNNMQDTCVAGGLQDYAFYEGPPATGEEVLPQMMADGVREWTLSGKSYLQCLYTDGSTRVHILPRNITQCRADGLYLTCDVWL